jgi:hypothetical protein
VTGYHWAPWLTDETTLHLVVPGGSPHHGACARYDVHQVLRGPRVDPRLAGPIERFPPSSPVCRECVEHVIALVRVDAEVETRVRFAADVRAELVCCDAYDVHRNAEDPLPAHQGACYWGEAVARGIEQRDDDDWCTHADGTSYFDRTVCIEPCGKMHMRCLACGDALDTCEVRAQAYFQRHLPTTPLTEEA